MAKVNFTRKGMAKLYETMRDEHLATVAVLVSTGHYATAQEEFHHACAFDAKAKMTRRPVGFPKRKRNPVYWTWQRRHPLEHL